VKRQNGGFAYNEDGMKQLILTLIAIVLAAGTGWAQTVEATTQPTPATQPAARTGERAVIVPIKGEINDFTVHILESRIEQAKVDGADTLILEINTPGGAVSSTLEMTRLLKKTGESLHTIAYVEEMAFSAGTMLAYACHEIVMEERSMIGDVAPIMMGQGGLAQIEGANRAKIESPLVAEFEDSAERNGHDPILARAFVQYQFTVYVLENEKGEWKYVAEGDLQRFLDTGWKLATDIKNPIDDELTLLTVNENTALRLGISKGTYKSIDDFARARGITILQRYEVAPGERVVGWLSSSGVRGLLSVVFMLSLYVAFTKPGTGLPEAAAVLSGVLLFGVPMLTGYAGILEISLILIGVMLLVVEIFVTPGFGFIGITGLIALLAGMVLTFVPSEAPALPGGGPSFFPQLPQTQESLKEGLIVTTVGLAVSFGLWLWLSRYLPKLPYFNRLVLTTTVGSTPEGDDPAREAVEATWPHVGAKGVAATDLRPGGMGRFYDTIINDDRNTDVICDHGFVAAGEAIIVRAKRGTEIIVRKV
jgi:membrane-bound serine protease (ClpP class)